MSKNILITLTLLFYHFSIAQHSDANKTNTSLNLDWKSRGPSNYSGITRAILWDKDDENTLYTGGIASGIYKSINKGESWFKLDSYADNNPSIASFAQSINGTIFVGTGSILGGSPEGALYSLAFLGNGIYKSSDNGNTWSHIQATSSNSPLLSSSEWTHVRAMATHPINTNILMVGNNSGVRISVNAESVQPEFFNALGIGPNVSDVKFTSDGKEAWAAANGRLYHSTDVLNNFTTFNINSPQLTGANRAQLTLSTVDNNGDYTIYASFASVSGCLLGIYKSEDKGANWTLLTSSGSYDPFQYPSSGCQGWYSHSLAVNPINKDILYIGGVTLGGFDSQGNLIQIDNIINETANNYLKSDKHFMLFNPQNAHEMLFGTEGGTYFCNQTITNYPSNLSFVSKNNGLNTSISFNADINKAGKILIGSYYFATRYIDYNQSNPYDAIDIWDETNATTEISNYNDGVIFYSGIFGNLKKSVNFGITNFPFTDSNIDPAGCNFVTCSPLNPSESCNDILFTGTDFINENFLFVL